MTGADAACRRPSLAASSRLRRLRLGSVAAGHLPVTMMGEPDSIMFRRILAGLVVGTLICAGTGLAQAQSAAPKPAKAAAAKQDAKPPAAATAAAGGSEPTLIGQFGTWGAYTATPNGK